MVVTCPVGNCKTITNSACVFYEGMSLLTTGIKTNDPVEIALQKIDKYLQDNPGGVLVPNTVINYRSSFESVDNKIYDGYILNGVSFITRTLDGVLENAINVTDLETDWNNRLNLTYI